MSLPSRRWRDRVRRWASLPSWQKLFIDSSDSHTGVSDRRSGYALKEREDSGAFMLTGVFIYSLTGGLLLSSAFHLFHLLRFGIRSVLGMQDHTNAHTYTVANTSHSCLPWMSETVMTVKAGGRMKGGVEDSWDHGKADPILIVLVRESSSF